MDLHVLVNIDTCQSKVAADQYHVTIPQTRVYSLLTKWWFLIGLWTQVKLTCKQGLVVQKTVNANPGLKVNQIIIFLVNVFHCFCFVYFEIIQNSKQKAKQFTENLTTKMRNSNQIFLLILGLPNRAVNNLTQQLSFQAWLNLYSTPGQCWK